MITQLRHVGVVVKDLKASLHFYKDVLGLQIRREMEEDGFYIDAILGMQKVRVQTVKLTTTPPGGGVELLYYHHPLSQQRKPCAINDTGITHLALTVVGLDELYGRLIQQGVRFISPPQVSPDGNVKIAFCQDPEGNYLELTEEIRK